MRRTRKKQKMEVNRQINFMTVGRPVLTVVWPDFSRRNSISDNAQFSLHSWIMWSPPICCFTGGDFIPWTRLRLVACAENTGLLEGLSLTSSLPRSLWRWMYACSFAYIFLPSPFLGFLFVCVFVVVFVHHCIVCICLYLCVCLVSLYMSTCLKSEFKRRRRRRRRSLCPPACPSRKNLTDRLSQAGSFTFLSSASPEFTLEVKLRAGRPLVSRRQIESTPSRTSYGLTGAQKGLKAWSRLEYRSECFDRLLCQEFYLAHSFDLKRFFWG